MKVPHMSSPRLIAAGRDWAKDTIAGLLASVVLIANIVSFAALMFPGDLSGGIPTAIWAMLIGSSVSGVWIALRTSLPPIATGIDSPTGAVLVLLSAAVAPQVIAGGGSPNAAIATVMLVFSAATLMSGALFYGLGVCRWGSYFRFVPYSVVCGFLAATGLFLVTGGVRMTTGHTVASGGLAGTWTGAEVAKLATAVAVLVALLLQRRWIKSAFAMPTALLVMWLTGAVVLQSLGLSGTEHGWYFGSLGAMVRWSPFEAARTVQLTWSTVAGLVPELLAVTFVALISLVTKVSSIEVTRQAAGNLDREFHAHGVASLIAAPFGGLLSSLQTGSSRLLEQAGAATRMSGVISALGLGAVAVMNFNLPGVIPIPLFAGLIFYMGYNFVVDGLWGPLSQRAWVDLVLTVAIMIVCIRYGYLVGVLVGVVVACLLFALSYAQMGVVRRHVTRAQFASYVHRSPEVSEHLLATGDAIQLYWLSGHIFFGSSESLFERIRGDIEALPGGRAAYVVLDFSVVTGADSSAIISLSKLRNFCSQQGTTLAYCALSPVIHGAFERAGLFGKKSGHRAFTDINAALAWCEDQLLTETGLNTDPGLETFEPWLQHQLGAGVRSADLVSYLERKDAQGSEILYREGEPADTVDLVASGTLAFDIGTGNGASVRVRRIQAHSVVGEMGFFRHSARSATVSSDGPATIFTLSRVHFERMRRERPELASAFDDFIIRVLADRLSFADREVTALSH
jgi:SulP family sulfate permease